MPAQFLPEFAKNQEKRLKFKKSKLLKSKRIKTKRINTPRKVIKIEQLDDWCLVKPSILKYGNCKYYRAAVRSNRSYYFCGAKAKGCKVCITLEDGRPIFISAFEHNHRL